MASIADKYKKLNGTDDTAISKQLIYPIDFASSNKDHPGMAVVFELNRLTSSKSRSYERALVEPSGQRIQTFTNSGTLNNEVSMQKDAGASSFRGNLKGGGSYVKTDMTIILPVPEQWQDSINTNWQAIDMASIGAAGDMINSLKELGNGGGGDAYDQALNSLPKMLGGAIQGMGGPSVKSFSELLTGKKANSYTEILFGGVTNRFFPFQWTLVPRNRKEAEVIRQIIHRFRWAMLPELADDKEKNGSFYRAPMTFDIHFVDLSTGRESKWWHKIGTCALTNVTANKTPQGEFATFGDDIDSQIPVAQTLELQFTELFVLDKANLDNPDESF